MASERGEGTSGRSPVDRERKPVDGERRRRRAQLALERASASNEPRSATDRGRGSAAAAEPPVTGTGSEAPRRRTSPRTATDRQLLAALAPATYHESGFRTDTRTAGEGGETRATALLAHAGYTIVERNYRCSLGELDIVARDGDVLAFVEVRSRADDSHGHAAEMVTRDKQHQVTRVAECYLLDREPREARMRFDVVAITGDSIELVKDAWRV